MSDKSEDSEAAKPPAAADPSDDGAGGDEAGKQWPRDPEAWLDGLVAAARFLTVAPMPKRPGSETLRLGDCVWAFPAIGIAVGIAGGGAAALAYSYHLPPLASALLGIAVMIGVTGALHEDGLGDVADGMFGTGDAKQRLAVMRDSRIGTFGVLAVVIGLGLRADAVAKLLAFTGWWSALLAVIAAAALSRAALPMMMHLLPLADDSGLAAEAGPAHRHDAVAGLAAAGLITLVCLGFVSTIAVAIFGAGLLASLAWLAKRQIGGYNGDVLGAGQQISETAILLVAAATL